MIGGGDCAAIGGMKIGKGNRSTRTKPALATLSPDPGSNPGRRGEKPATNRLSYGATSITVIWRGSLFEKKIIRKTERTWKYNIKIFDTHIITLSRTEMEMCELFAY
jgi:hypothetical protein